MSQLTTLDELKQHVTLLPSIQTSDAPFISCNLYPGDGNSWRETFADCAWPASWNARWKR